MKKIVFWILAVFVLSRTINFDWGFPGIVLFDSLSAFIIGVFIGGLQTKLRTTGKKYLKILIVSVIFALVAEPLILHYEVTLSLLEKTIGTHPSALSLYLEGFLRSITKLLIAVGLFFLLISGALHLLEISMEKKVL